MRSILFCAALLLTACGNRYPDNFQGGEKSTNAMVMEESKAVAAVNAAPPASSAGLLVVMPISPKRSSKKALSAIRSRITNSHVKN